MDEGGEAGEVELRVALRVVLRDLRARLVHRHVEAQQVERGAELAHLDRARAVGVELVERRLQPLLRHRRHHRLRLPPREQVLHQPREVGDVEPRLARRAAAAVLCHHLARARQIDVAETQQVERLPQLADVERPRLVGIELGEGGAQSVGRERGERRLRLLRRHQIVDERRELGEVETLLVVLRHHRLRLGEVHLHPHRGERRLHLLRHDRPGPVLVKAREDLAQPLGRRGGDRLLHPLGRERLLDEPPKLGHIELLPGRPEPRERLLHAGAVGGHAEALEGGAELGARDFAVAVAIVLLEGAVDPLGQLRRVHRLLLLPRDQVADEARERRQVEAARPAAARLVVLCEHLARLRRVDLHPQPLEGAAELGGVDAPRAVDVELVEGALDLRARDRRRRLLALLPRDEVAHELAKVVEVERALLLRAVPRHDVLVRRLVDVDPQ